MGTPFCHPPSKSYKDEKAQDGPGDQEVFSQAAAILSQQAGKQRGQIAQELCQIKKKLGHVEHQKDAYYQHDPKKTGRITQELKPGTGEDKQRSHQEAGSPIEVVEPCVKGPIW